MYARSPKFHGIIVFSPPRVHPIKYAHTDVVLCFVVVILLALGRFVYCNIQGFFTGTGAIIWLPQCQWSYTEGYVLNQPVSNHAKTTQIKDYMHNSWDLLHILFPIYTHHISVFCKHKLIPNDLVLWVSMRHHQDTFGPKDLTLVLTSITHLQFYFILS